MQRKLACLTTALVWLVMSTLNVSGAEARAGFKIAAFGTSFTAGGGWTEAVGRRLSQCLSRPVDVVVVAKPGATSTWGLENVGRVIAERPDLVLIEFYGNDSALDEWTTVAQSGKVLREILSQLQAGLPEVRIIYMAMNPMFGPRAWMRPWISSYIDEHRKAALEFGGEFIDFRGAWLALPDEVLRAAIPDGAHPVPSIAADIMSGKLSALIAGKACS